MALGMTQPVTEMSTRNILWRVKAAIALGWQPYHLHVSTALKSGSLNLLEPSGHVQACNGIALQTVPPDGQKTKRLFSNKRCKLGIKLAGFGTGGGGDRVEGEPNFDASWGRIRKLPD
jgi:hypothetical protein